VAYRTNKNCPFLNRQNQTIFALAPAKNLTVGLARCLLRRQQWGQRSSCRRRQIVSSSADKLRHWTGFIFLVLRLSFGLLLLRLWQFCGLICAFLCLLPSQRRYRLVFLFLAKVSVLLGEK
jgi:hypothetical protein